VWFINGKSGHVSLGRPLKAWRDLSDDVCLLSCTPLYRIAEEYSATLGCGKKRECTCSLKRFDEVMNASVKIKKTEGVFLVVIRNREHLLFPFS